MTRRVNTDQWRDHTQPPIIVWAYVGTWELEPVAVDDTHEADLYNEYTRAWYAAHAYKELEEIKDWSHTWYDLTPEQVEELYNRADGSAEAAGLPREYYAEGVNEDGSDAVIYVDEATEFESHRESLEEAAPYLDPEDVEEIRAAMLEARRANQ